MNPPPVFNPMIPYTGYFEGGFPPGKMVRIQGTVLPTANRFAINLQCPGDDIALHFNPRFHENKVVRNSVQCHSWGPEETYGHMPLMRGQPFEILILCEQPHFKIAVNGQHYVDYPHRIPYQRICSINVEGEVMITQISHEGGPGCAPPPYAPPGACPIPPPYPPGPGVPYPTGPGMPYPPTGGVYPPQPGYIPGHGAPPPPPGYPGHHPGGHGTVITHMSPKEAKKKNKMAKKALKYGLPIAGVGLGAYALSHAVGGHHHHHGFHHHSSSSSSSSSSSEEE